MRTAIHTLALLFAASGALCAQPARTALPIPAKPDPPIAIDGDLRDWSRVPAPLEMRTREQVVFGSSKWSGPSDLSATVRLAWRAEHLLLAASVRDDSFEQSGSGRGMWKGDHIELFLDVAPDAEPSRPTFGAGQFHLAFSPGNFRRTGDTLLDFAPECYVYTPAGIAARSVQVAARRTADGYVLEAAIPRSLLGVRPDIGLALGVEVAVSDSDSANAGQESMMTVGQTAWAHVRSRLLRMVLTPPDGRLPDAEHSAPLQSAAAAAATAPRALRVYEPARAHRSAYRVERTAPADLRLAVAGETFAVQSRFSTPRPGWVSGSNRYFTFERRFERRAEAVVVRDTFRNLTGENLPLIQRHRVLMRLQDVRLSGLRVLSAAAQTAEPSNPSAFGATARCGIGLLPMDDVSQVHAMQFTDGRSIGLGDASLVLRPRATHTTEWAIVPVARPDYFAFINAARRLLDVNFRIDGGFAFLRADPTLVGRWSDDEIKRFVRNKDARVLSITISDPRYKGRYAHGTAFQELDLSSWRDAATRWRRLVPGVRIVGYFEHSIDVLDGAEERFADSRVLRADGTQANYGDPNDRMFIAAANNRFGPAIAGNVRVLFDDLGFDGVYWDDFEITRDMFHYGTPWDGCTADIDPVTMRIVRLKSAIPLLTQAWRIDLARRIMARGLLIANALPYTRSIGRLHFPRFTETGSIENCALAQLFSPIALGDHLTEKSEADCYRMMRRALDYGCVYYWYHDIAPGIPAYPTLTRHMFPITPAELHEGVLIGRERILTNRGGVFGWGDRSRHEVHVYDAEGREAPARCARTTMRGGSTRTELRLPSGWSAAIVRR